MKRTLAVFLVPFGMLAFAVAVPERAVPEPMEQAIDFAGIDSVRIVDIDASITVGGDHTPGVGWSGGPDVEITTRREGSTLIVESHSQGYFRVVMELPAEIVRIELGDGTIAAAAPLDTMTIHVRDGLEWTGDAQRLVVVDTQNHATEAELSLADGCLAGAEFCPSIRIAGAIGELDVVAADSQVQISRPDRIGQATLRLWPNAAYSLGPMRSTENIHVILLDAAGQEQPTDTTVGFASDADVPPAGDDPNDKTD
jgi:hypothetical protein